MTQTVPEALLDTVHRTLDFAGRSTRKQFWLFIAFYIAVAALVPLFGTEMPQSGTFGEPVDFDMTQALSDFMLRQGLLFAVFVIPLMSVTARRLHDVGWSGWWAAPLLFVHLGVFLLQAKVMADSARSLDPLQSPFYGLLATMGLVEWALTIAIGILCVLPGNPNANDFGDPYYG